MDSYWKKEPWYLKQLNHKIGFRVISVIVMILGLVCIHLHYEIYQMKMSLDAPVFCPPTETFFKRV